MSLQDIIPILVDHSILCVLISLLGWALKKQLCEAKNEREGMQNRIFELVEQTNKFDQHTGHQLTELRQEIQKLENLIKEK